jgi:hypothetical protein
VTERNHLLSAADHAGLRGRIALWAVLVAFPLWQPALDVHWEHHLSLFWLGGIQVKGKEAPVAAYVVVELPPDGN